MEGNDGGVVVGGSKESGRRGKEVENRLRLGSPLPLNWSICCCLPSGLLVIRRRALLLLLLQHPMFWRCFFVFATSFGILFPFLPIVNGQKSFAETKFDLPADFPAEELPPIDANQDQKPSVETVAPASIQQPIATPPPTTIQIQTLSSQTPLPITSSAISIQSSFSVTSPSNPLSTTIINGTASAKTPLPLLPNLVDLPRFVQDGNIQPLTVPPSLIETSANANQSLGLSNSVRSTITQDLTRPSNLPPVAKVPPVRQGPLREQQIWFRDDFDTKDCPRNADAIARLFRSKFPRNLLRHQKETVLAELLAIRMRECSRKQRVNFWANLERQLEKAGDGEDTEKEECRVGLVQEQIACMNVMNFSCQFIQPLFVFRLVPTRLIVNEARLAEDGAEKCRKFGIADGSQRLKSRDS